jgi:hypothetical protein
MRWTICQLLTTALLSQALRIPSDITADGVYQVITRDDGSEVHTRVANVTDLGSTAEAQALALEVAAQTSSLDDDKVLNGRGIGQIWCGCGFDLNPGNCDAAVDDLKGQFGSYGVVNSGLSYYAIRSDVVAFVCNRSPSSFATAGETIARILASITDNCGRYIAGSKDMGVFDATPVIAGYMRYNGQDFCSDSTTSPVDRC